tara:strand:- start:2596 stop:2811 length:216 start_codon:yes stop_codon:yes gene_type:complete
MPAINLMGFKIVFSWGVSSEVEHSAFNRPVVGSIPTRPTILNNIFLKSLIYQQLFLLKHYYTPPVMQALQF